MVCGDNIRIEYNYTISMKELQFQDKNQSINNCYGDSLEDFRY